MEARADKHAAPPNGMRIIARESVNGRPGALCHGKIVSLLERRTDCMTADPITPGLANGADRRHDRPPCKSGQCIGLGASDRGIGRPRGMKIDLSGKRAIVTGGSRGIGRAIALGIAEAGASVSVCARGADGLAPVREAIAGYGVTAHVQACDVGDPQALSSYI